jgi:hypothetical protein
VYELPLPRQGSGRRTAARRNRPEPHHAWRFPEWPEINARRATRFTDAAGCHVRGWDTSRCPREIDAEGRERCGQPRAKPHQPYAAPAPGTGDLFSFVQPSPKPRSEPPRPSDYRTSSHPKLASLSDAELAGLLKGLLGEVQRRTAGRALRQSRPELERAVRETASILARLQPKQLGLSRRAPLKPPMVHEAKRKPIRAALLAGVCSLLRRRAKL